MQQHNYNPISINDSNNSPLQRKLRCAIIGCTGLVGQSIIESLIDHPWFQIESLYGHTSVGSTYGSRIKGNLNRKLDDKIKNKNILSISDLDLTEIDLVFSAIPNDIAKDIEAKIAQEVPVFSTAAAYRYEADVPIFLPIVNGHHSQIIKYQQKQKNWNGFICPGPNCTSVGLAIALYPIYQKFGLDSVHLVSMQAISGAGYSGVTSYDILGNIIPYIPNEEEKVKKELKKIFATIDNQADKICFNEPQLVIDCKCNRVPVLEGHTLSLFCQTHESASIDDIRVALSDFRGHTAKLNLPNGPKKPIVLFGDSDLDRPQPRIEFDSHSPHIGMQTFIGGLQKSNFTNGIKMTVLSHNTELGAGRGAVLNAEYLFKLGYFSYRGD